MTDNFTSTLSGKYRPRVAICGIHIESSTFSPQPAVADDFEVTRGEALLERYPWRVETWAQAIDWRPVLHARALPGGVLVRQTYEDWKAEILAELAALTAQGPLDGIFFDIHGAMSVAGLDDADGDLARSIRAVVGKKPLISASMDLHGNVSTDLFEDLDLLTCYRMAPHEDALESRRRAMANLADRLLGGRGRPTKVLVHIPILLPGEKTSTRVEPARRLYARIPRLAAQPGVLDAALWIGFAWADQPRCKAAVVITGDGAPERLRELALAWAEEIWAARGEFEFVAPVDSMAGCLAWAKDAARPTFISDSGDNPGAGGADDTTAALAALLAWEPAMSGRLQVICASLHDARAAAAAGAAGVGATAEFSVGGKIDARAPGPQALRARVEAIAEDPQGGRCAALRAVDADGARTGLVVVVTENRKQYADAASFALLGLDPAAADVVVVKIGYLEPDLYEMQAAWQMALTPGGVDQDLVRLGHRRIDRPMVPFDDGDQLAAVELRAVVRPGGTPAAGT